MVMTKFHVCVQSQPINEEWDAKLSSLSGKFRDLKKKAQGYVGGSAEAQVAPSPAQ